LTPIGAKPTRHDDDSLNIVKTEAEKEFSLEEIFKNHESPIVKSRNLTILIKTMLVLRHVT
jgi:hypothetical protein